MVNVWPVLGNQRSRHLSSYASYRLPALYPEPKPLEVVAAQLPVTFHYFAHKIQSRNLCGLHVLAESSRVSTPPAVTSALAKPRFPQHKFKVMQRPLRLFQRRIRSTL